MPAKSEEQRRLMAQAYAVKKGDLNPKDINAAWRDKIVDLANSMSLADLKDFAEKPIENINVSKKLKHIKLYEEFIKE